MEVKDSNLGPPDCQMGQYRCSSCQIVPRRRVLARPDCCPGVVRSNVRLGATLRDGFVGSNVGFLEGQRRKRQAERLLSRRG